MKCCTALCCTLASPSAHRARPRTTRLMKDVSVRRRISMNSMLICSFDIAFFSGTGGTMMPASSPPKAASDASSHAHRATSRQWTQPGMLDHAPRFCSCRRLWSQAKSRYRRMTSNSRRLYCGRLVLVWTLYDTYACQRRHCQPKHASVKPPATCSGARGQAVRQNKARTPTLSPVL